MEQTIRLEFDQHPIDKDMNKHQLAILLEIAQKDNQMLYTFLDEGGQARGYKDCDLRGLAKELGFGENEVMEAFYMFKDVRVKMKNDYSQKYETYPFVSDVTERMTMNLMSFCEADPDAKDDDFLEPSGGLLEVKDYIYCYNASIFDYMHLAYEDMKKMIASIDTNMTFNRLEAHFRECVAFDTNLHGETLHELIEVKVWTE